MLKSGLPAFVPVMFVDLADDRKSSDYQYRPQSRTNDCDLKTEASTERKASVTAAIKRNR